MLTLLTVFLFILSLMLVVFAALPLLCCRVDGVLMTRGTKAWSITCAMVAVILGCVAYKLAVLMLTSCVE